MSIRARWAVAAAGLVIAIGLVALYVFNASLTADRSPKIWVVQPGETLRLSSDQVPPEDQHECPGRPGTVVGTPKPESFASA